MFLQFQAFILMNSNSINSIIEKYIHDNFTPKVEEQKFITDKFEQLCGLLKEYEDAIFKNGSWARFTATSPVRDLDAVWPLPPSIRPSYKFTDVIKKRIDPHSLDVSNILKDLAKRLGEEYNKAGNNVIAEPQSHSVGIFFSPDKEGFSIDLVPAIPTGEVNEYGDDLYYVPEIFKMSRKRRQMVYKMSVEKKQPINWIKTDPKGYINDSTKVNEINKAYRKASKFTKMWNYGCKDHNDNHPLKSFHLELICQEIVLKNKSINTYETILSFFNDLENYLQAPKFPDRADKNRCVDLYLTEITDLERLPIIKRISKAVLSLNKLGNVQSESEATTIIEDIIEGNKTLPNIHIQPAERKVTPSGAWSM